jgi:hypothetical protein
MACALALCSPAGAGPLLPANRESGTCSRRTTAAPHARPDPAPVDGRAYRDHPSDLDNHRQAGDSHPASNPDPAGDGHHPEFDPDGKPHGGSFPHRHTGGYGLANAVSTLTPAPTPNTVPRTGQILPPSLAALMMLSAGLAALCFVAGVYVGLTSTRGRY